MTDDRGDNSEGGEILLGRWDCASCGARGLSGDAYQCASCGAPRPEDVQFYLPDDAPVVRDPEGVRAAEAGPDWQCAFCQSWMPATDTVCRNCRAPLEASLRRQKTGPLEAEPMAEDPAAAPRQGLLPLASRLRAVPRHYWIATAMVVAAAAGWAILHGMRQAERRRVFEQEVAQEQELVAAAQLRRDEASGKLRDAEQRVEQAERAAADAQTEATAAERRLGELQRQRQSVERAAAVTVKSHRWTAQLEIEQCVAREGEGWDHPPEAFDVRSEQRVHHHEKVLDRMETLFRSETYRTQEGFDTETYTERVAAGTRQVPDGYTVENLGNGRFRRTPKYRTETIYQTVTKTRQKPRMVTKTRLVPYLSPVYRQAPVQKPWYKYRTRAWVAAPAMSRTGEGLDVRDPEGRPPDAPGSEVGTKRVRSRRATYAVIVESSADSSPRTVAVPEERWRSLADGSRLFLAGDELLAEDQRQAKLASLGDALDAAVKQIDDRKARVPPLVERLGPLRELLPPLRQALAETQAELLAAQVQLEAVVARAGRDDRQ